jgi:hypothetical protein
MTPQFQPFIQCLFDELVMCLWNLELFPVNWILCLEMNLVFEILGQTQVIFVNTKGNLVFAQYVQVSFLIFLWYLQMALSLDFFPG